MSSPKNLSQISSHNMVPFSYLNDSFISLPVLINGNVKANFILDTGAGVNIISNALCEKINCSTKGSYKGKRMSGQEITLPLVKVAAIQLGEYSRENVPVGIMDLAKLIPSSWEVDGFLSLEYFKEKAFTVDYKRNIIIIENAESIKQLISPKTTVPIAINHDGPSLSVELQLEIQGIKLAKVEVDTGSNSLILHKNYMKLLGVKTDDVNVKKSEGIDETGNTYLRYFSEIKGEVFPINHPKIVQKNPRVMFQDIIYDGLIGHSFLSQFIVTYDLPNSQMIFSQFN